MIKEFINAWGTNKDALRDYIKITPQSEYDDYRKLVELLFTKVINPYLKSCGKKDLYNINEITELTQGSYQGVSIFIIHKNSYDGDLSNFVYTTNYFGSCSGCDTLLRISNYKTGLPSEDQVNDYMLLLLNLLQQCNMFLDIVEYEIVSIYD